MPTVDLIKKKFLWIILGAIIFYVLLILISDVEKISESFLQIKAEFLVLIFALGFVSHVVKSFRQKDLLNTLGEKHSKGLDYCRFWQTGYSKQRTLIKLRIFKLPEHELGKCLDSHHKRSLWTIWLDCWRIWRWKV